MFRGASLPRRLGVVEVDVDSGVDTELDVLSHFSALIPGQRLPQVFGSRCTVWVRASRTASAVFPSGSVTDMSSSVRVAVPRLITVSALLGSTWFLSGVWYGSGLDSCD